VRGRHGHGLRHLFVHNHVDLDALLGLALEESVEPPFGERSGRAAKVLHNETDRSTPVVVEKGARTYQLGREPPIQDEDALLGVIYELRDRPHVVVPVDMPSGDRGRKVNSCCAQKHGARTI
jgi:hypothetical protein